MCVHVVDRLKERIMEEAYSARYSILLRSKIMLRYLKEVYRWEGMKKGIVDFVSKCPNFHQVKVENQRPGDFAQNIEPSE